MSTNPMLQATTALLRYVREGRRPGPPPNVSWLRPWGLDLSGQERGGSANHGLLGWTVEYARRESRVPDYLVHRLKWELKNGLMAHEQMSPTYGGLHLGCVCILWYVAWSRGDKEVARLAGAWVERVLLLECLTGRREGDRIRLMSPGMRADVRSVTHGRQVESAIVGQLLGIPQDLRLDHSTWWGPLLQAVRACEGLERVAGRVRNLCRTLLGHKPRPGILGNSTDFQRIRLMVPMRFHAWPSGDWFAWIPRSTHPQDPGKLGGGVIDGEHVFLWPWEDGSDPPEEGWQAKAHLNDIADAMDEVVATWWHKGRYAKSSNVYIPPGPAPEIIGLPSGPDPLGDLPPAPDPRKHPWRQGGRGEGREPEPPEDDWKIWPSDITAEDIERNPGAARLMVLAGYALLDQESAGAKTGSLNLQRLRRAARRHQRAVDQLRKEVRG